jgi:hypothetical protein
MRLLCAALVSLALVQPTGDLVELDVTVTDRDGLPVLDLTSDDFQVKEDGHAVEIKTFDSMSAVASSDFTPRHMVLLLDDTVSIAGTSVMQAMAQAVVSRGRLGDEVTVVRLNNDRDEPFGDLETALGRIAAYRGGMVPRDAFNNAERALLVIGRVSRQLDAVEHRRKLVVCLGSPGVCNVSEPRHGHSHLWDLWVDAVSAMARANVALYGIMPVRPGSGVILGGGLIDATGGDGFYNNTKFEPFVDALWREAGQYYFLGYWPAARKGDLRDVDVKVRRKGVHVRARRQRG